MGNLLQTRPAETTTAAAGTIGAIIAAAASHDYTTAVVLAVVSYLPAIITLLHLQTGTPGRIVDAVGRIAGELGIQRAPGESDEAFATRLARTVEKVPGDVKVLVDGRTVAPEPPPRQAAPDPAASTDVPPPIQGS